MLIGPGFQRLIKGGLYGIALRRSRLNQQRAGYELQADLNSGVLAFHTN